jgi:phosphatidylglycerophosphate synthase
MNTVGRLHVSIMFDAVLRPLIGPPLDRLASIAVRTGLTANVTTVLGFALGLGAVPFIVSEAYLWAIPLILVSRILDGLDGAIARRTQTTDLGAYLDITLDFIFYAAIVFAFALARTENALPAAFLLFSFSGTASTFLAFAIFAAKRGIITEIRGRKSLYYLGGLTEGAETIAVFVLACVFPDAFAWIAIIFGGLCLVTTGTRIAEAWKILVNPSLDK